MNTDDTPSQIKRVVTMSQLEVIGSIFLLVGLAFFVGVSVFNANDYVKQTYETIQGASPAYANYEQVSLQINSNEYVANATIFIVWAITGMLAFYTMLILWGSEKSLAEVIAMMRQGGESMKLALEERLVRFAIRIGAAISLLLFVGLFVKTFLPLLIVWLSVNPDRTMLEHILTILGAWVVLGLSVHIVTVLLRCISLRQRLVF